MGQLGKGIAGVRRCGNGQFMGIFIVWVFILVFSMYWSDGCWPFSATVVLCSGTVLDYGTVLLSNSSRFLDYNATDK